MTGPVLQDPSVLCVILNWRTPEMTLRAAEAARIAMQGLRGGITIVDNASGDGSFETISAAVAARGWADGPTPVQVLLSEHNGGFGAGNNVGMRAGLPAGVAGAAGARPDLVFLLNSDAFPEPAAIRALRDHLIRHPRTGIAGAFIMGEDGAAHHTAFRFPGPLGEFEAQIRLGAVSRLLSRHVIAPPLPEATGRVDWLAGAAMMLRQDVLDHIGLFDETFFLYFEETDLCLRAARAGWPTDYVREARVVHIGSVSTGMKAWQRIPGFWLDSRLHYFAKNHGRLGAVLATLGALGGGALWRLRLLVQRSKRPQDPPHLLRDMLAHHLRHGFRLERPGPAGPTASAAVKG